LDEHLCRAFPQTRSASELSACAKDQASLLHDGMLEESATATLFELFGVNDQPVAARERYSGFISKSLLLLIFCIELIHEDEYRFFLEAIFWNSHQYTILQQ